VALILLNCMKEICTTMVTGTSGIGKSFYLLYLMYRLVQESRNNSTRIPVLLYKTGGFINFLLLSSGAVQRSTIHNPGMPQLSAS